MNVLMQFAVALAPVLAAWAVAASVAAIRTGRADLAVTAWRGLFAATTCAVAATAGLVAALVTSDLSVRFVAQTWSEIVSLRYLPAALLNAPGGALLTLAALTGVAGLIVVASVGPAARIWAVAAVGGTMFVSLTIAALYGAPFAARVVRADGAGLSPDLQRGGAVLHAVALLLATVFATASFVETIAAVAGHEVNDGWSRRVRGWNVLAWTALFVGVVAGARWYAMNPVRGAWLESPSTALWLLPCAAGAWLVHLDTGSQAASRVVTRMLLSVGIFVAVTVAVAYADGAFVTGVVEADAGHGGALLGVVPAIAIAVFIARLRRGAGLLRASAALRTVARGRAGGWMAHAGFVLLVGAAGGSRFTRTHTVTLGDAEIFRAKDPFGHQWQFSSQGVSTLQRENYASLTVSLMPQRDGQARAMLSAEVRSYGLVDGSDFSKPAFIAARMDGVFMETRLTITGPDGKRPTIQIAFVPLGSWLVVGAWLVAVGMLVAVAGSAERDPA